jgi:predicted glycosyltransferase
MRILIDINHPAHVHYFRNFIKIMESKGHNFLVIARDKEVTFNLLKAYNISFLSRGKGGKGFLGKILYMAKGDYLIYKAAKEFKPDIFLSFGSAYAAQVSALTQKPHIAFDDTEHAKIAAKFYRPFSQVIFTPTVYLGKNFRKQLRFNGYMELCYLHPNYFSFTPKMLVDPSGKNKKYVIIRFVSWDANHDMYNQNKGLSLEEKLKLIKYLEDKLDIFISSEIELPDSLKKFQLKTPPNEIHALMHHAELFVGESLTMASEAAILGTPAICISTINAGTLQDQIKRGLVKKFENFNGVISAIENISKNEYKKKFIMARNKLIEESIDVTKFMVWMIENYPESIHILKTNPE